MSVVRHIFLPFRNDYFLAGSAPLPVQGVPAAQVQTLNRMRLDDTKRHSPCGVMGQRLIVP